MDFEFICEQTPLYIEAAKLTLHMAVIGVTLKMQHIHLRTVQNEPQFSKQ